MQQATPVFKQNLMLPKTGAGLGTDGAYTANGCTNYLTTVTSLTSADVALDTQIKTVSDQVTNLSASSSSGSTNIQSELDATQAVAGLGTDGAYTADGSTNYLTTVTSLTSADVALDTSDQNKY
ncbi:hypothetical protein BST83_02045 [Polaribacter filamentus]|uniref:Flagellin N-terminal domain-containing protein n=2 Tax=Polaribacter filamentus TaxID=53483 RepID=A0A2S7KU22_9FLAO|nr:hypothetical protein BST83_02045 [Polaribacter filamentus]